MSFGKTMWSGQTTVSNPRSSPRRTSARMDSGAESGPLPGMVKPYFMLLLPFFRQCIDGPSDCQCSPSCACSDKIDQIVPIRTQRDGRHKRRNRSRDQHIRRLRHQSRPVQTLAAEHRRAGRAVEPGRPRRPAPGPRLRPKAQFLRSGRGHRVV